MRRIFFLLAPVFCLIRPAWAQPQGPLYLGETRPAGVPDRVVSLAPNLTEILFALGAGSRVVGVTTYDDYPPQVNDLARVGGFIDPSLEGILALKPDLVVCVPNPGGRDRLDALARMGIPVLVLPSYNLEDIFVVIEKLGNVFERQETARTLVSGMKDRIETVSLRVKKLSRPRVLLVYGHKPVIAAGKGSFADRLLNIAGGENVLTDSAVRYPTVPIESVIRLGPDVIIDASASGTGSEMSSEEVQAVWARWKVVPAVRNKRIFIFDSALWFRPGPRIVEGLEKLAQILHPTVSATP
jgi:iron complex transport system substrate-binding protein